MADRDLLGCTLGDYVLRELIGKGGYGEVYRGEQPALEREVVVKVLHAQRTDNDSRERFLREARLAAQLDHLYAAHVYDFGAKDEGDVLWIAMERVRGVPLDAWLNTHGPMPPQQLGPFFEALCEVVHSAHEVAIVHRDLKPSNIMVVESRGLLLPKLLDFGIAKWNRPSEVAPDPGSDEGCASDRDEVKTKRLPVRPRRAGRNVICHDSEIRRQLTPPGGCLGSPPYMAPEQRRGADGVGPEADIYALGVVAYEMLTARLPFVADRTDDYFDQHQRAPVPRLGDGFPLALDRVIQRALDKNPRARFGSALDLAAALRRALRASMREQLRTSAQQWHEQCAPSGLLWGADVLEDALRSVPRDTLGPLECSFVAESQRRIRRARWARRLLVALAAAIAVGGLLYRAAMQAQLAEEQTRMAREVSEATVTQAELEQGRSALLHGEPDASLHLSRAYQRGDRSSSTTFMLARALQPRLAEQARLPSSSGRMWSAMFSPDGTKVVTTDDMNARIWNAQTNQLLFTLAHGDIVYQSVFNSDGTRLITAGGDGVVRIWDATSGSLVRQLQRAGIKPRYAVVARSPDDKLVAAIGIGGTATYVWSAASGVLVAELRRDPSDGPSIAFSPMVAGWQQPAGVLAYSTRRHGRWFMSSKDRAPGV
jgi:serine/threonine protein kinase